ncbi:DUF3006 domain-containing protein [Clostridium tetani]|uniref:DUF3006 domain-containing protein n=1 Tax=Clostridium tetani TaxID=1513 RepID=A0A4Q0VB43_CLOTA|nr:DUF3006 domain-containing protein [Clostridium tetani]KGI43449.1 pyruvate kinase [Clostridium tetani]RXI46641.1 DUF3006 domain-containing protein [Clostridium tetani]RXI53023.1 DUF3006 domain-containing protein [Clostridium tetani]RXI74191.1 DUF3006 domain-containing protein [Clostridium tetani]BDR68483.1 hypothetical protein K144312032_27110 [Clostridium tetani]
MLNGVIDRFEEEYAVVELEDGSMLNLPKLEVPKEAKEGDALLIKLDVSIDYNKTEKLKKEIEELTKDLWED